MNAYDMIRLADNLRLLQQIERATGQTWVTRDDVRSAVDARNALVGRPSPRRLIRVEVAR